MTTTVTVKAHCREGIEVLVETTNNNGDASVVLKDGEEWQGVVYDSHSVTVKEREVK